MVAVAVDSEISALLDSVPWELKPVKLSLDVEPGFVEIMVMSFGGLFYYPDALSKVEVVPKYWAIGHLASGHTIVDFSKERGLNLQTENMAAWFLVRAATLIDWQQSKEQIERLIPSYRLSSALYSILEQVCKEMPAPAESEG